MVKVIAHVYTSKLDRNSNTYSFAEFISTKNKNNHFFVCDITPGNASAILVQILKDYDSFIIIESEPIPSKRYWELSRFYRAGYVSDDDIKNKIQSWLVG